MASIYVFTPNLCVPAGRCRALTVAIELWNGLPSHVGATPCVARKSLQFHRVALSPAIRLALKRKYTFPHQTTTFRPGDAGRRAIAWQLHSPLSSGIAPTFPHQTSASRPGDAGR